MAVPIKPARKTAQKRRKTNTKRFSRRPELEVVRDALHQDYTTSERKPVSRFLRHGKPFLGAFKTIPFGAFEIKPFRTHYESPVGIAITNPAISPNSGFHQSGIIRIGFEKNTVTIEAINGTYGCKNQLDAFSKTAGMPWAQFLIRKIEATARRQGYHYLKFRDPQTMYYYKQPEMPAHRITPAEKEQTKKEIQARMNRLYSSVRKKIGGFTQREGDYWVKEL